MKARTDCAERTHCRRKTTEGSILIGLIITIVIFSALAAAVVPFISSSYMSKVSGSQAAKAYYMAESGFRYAASRYLHGASSIARDDILENELHGTTYTLNNNGGNFTLKVEGYFYKYNSLTGLQLTADAFGQLPTEIPDTGNGELMVAAYSPGPYPTYEHVDYTGFIKTGDSITFTLNTAPSISSPARVFPAALAASVPSAGSLTLQNNTGQALFPAKSGSFKVFDSSGSLKFNGDLFLYEELSGDTLSGITNVANPATLITSTSISSGDVVAMQRFVKITSTGAFGTGVYASSRELIYNIALEANAISGTPPEHVIDLDDLVEDNPLTPGVALGNFEVSDLGGDDALGVVKSTSGKRVETVIALDVSPNPFYLSWSNAGEFLSYDAQVKIGTGEWSSGQFINKPEYYMAGLSTRVDGLTAGKLKAYGISFIRTSIATKDGIPDSLVPDSLLVDTPLILLWDRGGRGGHNSYVWLAYLKLAIPAYCDEAEGDTQEERSGNGGTWVPAVDNSNVLDDDIQCLKDWSTITVRMVEAASIKYSGSSAIVLGDTVTGGSSGATGYVIKKIGDGSDEVLLLNNVDGTFSARETVSNGTVSVPVSGWRAKDNYIWAFYGDTDTQGTPDDVALNQDRGKNLRSGDLNWPPASIDDWSSSTDHFTLVQWNSALNTAHDPSLTLMGTGKELNGIIRTNLYVTASSPETYNTDDHPELGLHAFGDTAIDVYFDDFAFYIETGASGSAGFINTVVTTD